MKRIILPFLLLAMLNINAETIWLNFASPFSLSMGEISNISGSTTMFYENPATLRFSNNSISLNYSSLYGISDLYVGSFLGSLNLKPFSLGASLYSCGIYGQMSQNIFGFSISRELTDKFILGINLHYFIDSVTGYKGNDNINSEKDFNMNLGVIFKPIEHFSLSFSINNVFKKNEFKLNWGAVYTIKDFVIFAFEMKNNTPHEGVKVNFFHVLFLDFGHNGEVFTFGFGVKYKKLKVHFTLLPNSNIGSTYIFSINYVFGAER